MIIDQQWVFSDNQAPDAYGVGSQPSAFVHRQGPLDAGNLSIVDLAAGYGAHLYLESNTTPTSGGSATMELQFVSSASSDLSSPNIHWRSGVFDYDSGAFDDGQYWTPRINPNEVYLEYIGVLTVIAVAAIADFTFSAFLVDCVPAWKAYASRANFGYGTPIP